MINLIILVLSSIFFYKNIGPQWVWYFLISSIIATIGINILILFFTGFKSEKVKAANENYFFPLFLISCMVALVATTLKYVILK
jgi:hypothetical protein